jgi:hypothetical protein
MILSSRGLKSIVCDDSSFPFKVNGCELAISKFKAQFISPAVSRSLSSGPTQSTFEIEVPEVDEFFELIPSLCEGNIIYLDQAANCGIEWRERGRDSNQEFLNWNPTYEPQTISPDVPA